MKLSKLKKGTIAYIKSISPDIQDYLHGYGIINGSSIELIHNTKITHSVFKVDGTAKIILGDEMLELIEIYLSTINSKI